jgi:protein ImuA
MTANPALLEDLRRRIGPACRAASPVLPFGDARIDAHLPGNGLPIGHLHEIGAPDGPASDAASPAAGFASVLAAGLARRDQDRAVLWIATCCDLYAPGLLAFGLNPARLIVAQAGTDAEALQTAETALRSAAAAVVVAEAATLGGLASRRLSLAAQHGASTLLLLRRRRRGPAGLATTRWLVAPAPSAPCTYPATGAVPPLRARAPRWRVDLLHARGGRQGAWIMEAEDASDHVRVVAVLGDDAAASRAAGPEPAGWRAAG